MNVSIIVAIADNNAIGNNQDLLCYMPADLKHFKELTTGHTVVMGRKTFESLPKGALPNRDNIVLTRNKEISFPNTKIVSSMQEAIDVADKDKTLFIIGGASVYNEALAFADTMNITSIHHKFDEADTFFPQWNVEEWIETERTDLNADEKNPYDFSFVTFKRK